MKITIGLAGAALGLALCSFAWSGGADDAAEQSTVRRKKRRAPAADYVVHEWGTFTSMQGSDGLTLEGLQHEEESLPDFVYSRAEVRECPLRDLGYKGLEVEVSGVTEKMETPVTYFYSKKPRRVRMRVELAGGLLTQWYPVVDRLGPPERTAEEGPLDMSQVARSFLEWDVELLPFGMGRDLVPPVAPDDPWAFARLPESNVLRTIEREEPRIGPVEHEEYLFYRGLGRFDLPIQAETKPGSRIALTNDGAHPIRHLFTLHVRDGRGEFRYDAELPAGGALEVQRPLSPDAKPVGEMVSELMPAMEARLVEEGLYPAEAKAMVLTWQRSYFHTEGLRVLYVVPREVTEALLPLKLEPRPRELVRVLVGRLECISPEVELEVTSALRERCSDVPERRIRAEVRLARLGRFLEAHVRNVLAKTDDETVLRSGRELLNEG